MGRKYAFLMTISIMGFATVAVGLLPAYQAIGIVAPIVLVTLRLLQSGHELTDVLEPMWSEVATFLEPRA